jgi:hypothetical protein
MTAAICKTGDRRQPDRRTSTSDVTPGGKGRHATRGQDHAFDPDADGDISCRNARTMPPELSMTTGARDTALALLASRSPGATVCPSEVARAIAPEDAWRDAMPLVHAAVDGLVEEGRVRLSWKGRSLATRAGPYRIGRAIPPS